MACAHLAPAGAAVLQQDVVGGRVSVAWDYPLSSQEKNWRLLALFQREVDDLQGEVAELQRDADHWEDRCTKLMARAASKATLEAPNADNGSAPVSGAEASAKGAAGASSSAVEDAEARLSQSANAAAGQETTAKSSRRQRRAMRREPFKALDWHRSWSRTYESIAGDALDRVDSTALRTEAARIAEVAQTQVADLGEAATARAQDLGEVVQAHAKDLGDSAEQLRAELADSAQALGESLAQFWGEASFPFPSVAKETAEVSSSRRRPQRRASWALGDLFGRTEDDQPTQVEIAESWAVANSPAADALRSAEVCPDESTPGSPCME